MKVLDIITETTPPSPAPAAFVEADVIANWLRNNPHLEVREKYDPNAGNFYTKWISKNKNANAQVMEAFAVRYGAAFTFLKAIGIIAPLTLCVLHLRALNEQAKEKDADGNYVHSIEWVKAQENAIVGVFLASQIAGIIVTSIRNGMLVGSLKDLLKAVAMRSPGGAKLAIVTMIASEVGMIALKTWLNTPQGIEWCTHGLVMPIIVGGLGALGNTILEYIRDKVKEHTGKDIGVVTPDINDRKDKETNNYAGPDLDAIKRHEAEVRQRTNPLAR